MLMSCPEMDFCLSIYAIISSVILNVSVLLLPAIMLSNTRFLLREIILRASERVSDV